MTTEYSTQDLLIPAGQGEATETHLTIKVRPERLGGAFSIMEGEIAAHQLLPPHSHTDADQLVYVLTGTLHFEVGGKDGLHFSASAGATVIKPRGIVHGFWNSGDVPARYLELSTGDSFARFVDSRKMGMIRSNLYAEKELGMTFDLARIPELMVEHRLTSIASVELPELPELPPPLRALLDRARRGAR